MILINKLKKIFSNKSVEFIEIEKRIDYTFSNTYYLEKALTHRSVQDHSQGNYERLEFVGDAVIDQTVSLWLFKKYPNSDEGNLTKIRSTLVNREFLSIMGMNLKLSKYIRVDQSVNISDPKVLGKISADVFEAIVGAIYLDGGYKYASKFINKTICKHDFLALKDQNYKGQLIEYCHKMGLPSPQFNIISSSGPEHEKTFIVNVEINEKNIWEGTGSTKKSAEQNCAKKAIENLSER